MKRLDMVWRWLESCRDECRSEQNLLIDQAIFEAHQENAVAPTIRLYTWDKPVVSLGRLQSEEKVRREFFGRNLVRRTTGGLAVEHGDDLTISIVALESVLPKEIVARPGGVLASYFALLTGIVNALRESGVEATYGAESESCPITTDCFGHLGRCDVYDSRTHRKILGSAQRRANGFVLQQMSLRPLPGLDVHSASFRSLLQRQYHVSFSVSIWQNETKITSFERGLVQEAGAMPLKEL